MFREIRSRRGWPLAFCLGAMAVAAGCSGAPSFAPVAGKVTVDGQAVVKGVVSFTADLEKGNQLRATPSGAIGPDGRYALSTDGATGAPPGWYKVVIATDVPGAETDAPAQPVARINPRYTSATATPLSVEVKSDGSGSYDLKLTP